MPVAGRGGEAEPGAGSGAAPELRVGVGDWTPTGGGGSVASDFRMSAIVVCPLSHAACETGGGCA